MPASLFSDFSAPEVDVVGASTAEVMSLLIGVGVTVFESMGAVASSEDSVDGGRLEDSDAVG
jgi:hypothetical protein